MGLLQAGEVGLHPAAGIYSGGFPPAWQPFFWRPHHTIWS